MLLEGDPFLLLEGMAIAAHAVGATHGWIYVRSEYPRAVEVVTAAAARFPYLPIEVRVGAGAYICGEETAMLESIEGRRGVVRAKPPLPAIEGLFGRPTVVNNVLTFAAVPAIVLDPAAPLTHVVQLAGNVERPGLFEVDEGTPLRGLIGRTRTGRPIGAVQVGGPLGPYLGPDQLDIPIGFESFAAAGAMLGHGGVVVFDDTVDPLRQARFAMHFCAEESCGKCTPCRVGAVRGREVLDRVLAGERVDANLALLDDLCDVMAGASLCAMGGLTPNPVRSAVRLSKGRLAR
jgi:formate dehydrogenase iron-sulfur subunit